MKYFKRMLNIFWEKLARIKWGTLTVVISCLGITLSMAVSVQEEGSSDVVSATTRKISPDNPSDTSKYNQIHPDFRFDLHAIIRNLPDKIKYSSLFQAKSSWYVLPITSTGVSEPIFSPPPSAPPLSFTYIGTMIDKNEITLFLYKNDRQYTVKENDILDDIYRVDKIVGNNLVLTYLPLNTQQTLALSSMSSGMLPAQKP